MFVKEPARMELLNQDGSRNDGMELAITLFVQLSQSEMMNKKSRFARARKRNASDGRYRCKCDSEAISIANMDGFLWWVAYDKECNWRMKNDKDNKANIRKEMAVLQRKIDAADSGKAKVEIKRQRALNAYLDAAIDEDQYNDRIAKVNEELKSINFNIAQWKDAMSKMEAVLNSVDGVDIKKKYEAVMNNVESADEREMQSIVRKWIIRVDMDLPYVKLTCSDGKEYTAKYHLRMKKMIWSTMGGGYLPIYPIYKNDEGLQIANPRNNNSNMMKAIDRNERQLGIVEIVNNIGKFWKNSIL